MKRIPMLLTAALLMMTSLKNEAKSMTIPSTVAAPQAKLFALSYYWSNTVMIGNGIWGFYPLGVSATFTYENYGTTNVVTGATQTHFAGTHSWVDGPYTTTYTYTPTTTSYSTGTGGAIYMNYSGTLVIVKRVTSSGAIVGSTTINSAYQPTINSGSFPMP